MLSIIYYSEAKQCYRDDELIELAKRANIKNSTHCITGFITYKSGHFVQYIEGEEDKVEHLFNLIKKDERHNVKFHISKKIKRSLLNCWNMRLITEKTIEELSIEYFLLGQFNLVNKKVLTLDLAEDLIWQGVKLISKHQANITEKI